jgi:hypothetical protein
MTQPSATVLLFQQVLLFRLLLYHHPFLEVLIFEEYYLLAMQRRAVGPEWLTSQKIILRIVTAVRGATVSFMLTSCLASSSVLMMEATYSSETSVDIQWIA